MTYRFMSNRILQLAGLMAVLLCAVPGAPLAQTASARGQAGGGTMGNIQQEITQISNALGATKAEIEAMEACLAQHQFYTSGGCVGEIDPKVATPINNNSICTSDGSKVKCLTLDSSMVFTRTAVSGSGGSVRTATVYCPSTALRVGCSGARGWSGGMSSTCPNASCGYVGVMPVDDAGGHGCKVMAVTTTEQPAVVATCFSPNGGS